MKFNKVQYIKEINADVDFEVEAEWCDADNRDAGVEVLSAEWDKSLYTKTENLVINEKVDLNDFDFDIEDFF